MPSNIGSTFCEFSKRESDTEFCGLCTIGGVCDARRSVTMPLTRNNAIESYSFAGDCPVRVDSRSFPSAYFFLEFFRGTFPPARRASDSPIAMACLRLVTFLPERPLFKVPRLRSCIARFTFSDAFLPYLAMGSLSFLKVIAEEKPPSIMRFSSPCEVVCV